MSLTVGVFQQQLLMISMPVMTVVQCLVVAAAMNSFQMKCPNDMPVYQLLQAGLWSEDNDKQKDTFDSVTKEIALL